MSQAKAFSYIRFSSPAQSGGDSVRRQSKAARAYCSSHNLLLDEELTFQDFGVSAFRGRNVDEGALGAFLNAIKAGIASAGRRPGAGPRRRRAAATWQRRRRGPGARGSRAA